MDCLAGVCQDISNFLSKLYQENWALRFEKVYKDHIKRSNTISEGRSFSMWDKGSQCSGRDYIFLSHHADKEIDLRAPETQFWSNQLLMDDTYTEFFKYIDYQLMMGLPFLARIYRLSLDPMKPELPAQTQWTTSFHAPLWDNLKIGPPTEHGVHTRKGCESFQLTPAERGTKGYKLSMTLPYRNIEYLIKPSKTLFMDGSFKSAHLGDLTRCSRCQQKREAKEKSEAARQMKESIPPCHHCRQSPCACSGWHA